MEGVDASQGHHSRILEIMNMITRPYHSSSQGPEEAEGSDAISVQFEIVKLAAGRTCIDDQGGGDPGSKYCTFGVCGVVSVNVCCADQCGLGGRCNADAWVPIERPIGITELNTGCLPSFFV